MVDPLAGWTDFNVAMTGATAALAGLVVTANPAGLVAFAIASMTTITAALLISWIALVAVLR